ncbi:MAG: aspartate/glutamate racemase family protein [Gammaproteobacteria bacterium]|nr:aspartate/glutamate racemase family protein [Gammaproteobacteria bacterium]
MTVAKNREDSCAAVGILMLNTRFPRIPGDIGNKNTWPFATKFRVVHRALPVDVVFEKAAGLLDDFIEAATSLVAEGVSGITTSCGFLSLFQQDLSNAVNVPVASSSLMQASMVKRLLPTQRQVGILTVSDEALTEEHLRCAAVPEGTPVVGMSADTEFSRVFLTNQPTLDVQKACSELVATAKMLVNDHPRVGAIILECTNMAPYAHAIGQATGLPVFSMYTFVSWFQAGLCPAEFARE